MSSELVRIVRLDYAKVWWSIWRVRWNQLSDAVEEAELMAAVQINSVYTGIAGSHIGSESAQGVVALKKREVNQKRCPTCC